RLGRREQPRRWWAPRPIRPRVPHHLGREFVYVLAAAGGAVGGVNTPGFPPAGSLGGALFFPPPAGPCRAPLLVLVGAGGGVAPRSSPGGPGAYPLARTIRL